MWPYLFDSRLQFSVSVKAIVPLPTENYRPPTRRNARSYTAVTLAQRIDCMSACMCKCPSVCLSVCAWHQWHLKAAVRLIRVCRYQLHLVCRLSYDMQAVAILPARDQTGYSATVFFVGRWTTHRDSFHGTVVIKVYDIPFYSLFFPSYHSPINVHRNLSKWLIKLIQNISHHCLQISILPTDKMVGFGTVDDEYFYNLHTAIAAVGQLLLA